MRRRSVCSAAVTVLTHWLAEFRRVGPPPVETPALGLFLLQDLPALVHAGLEVEMVRAAELAGVLVPDIGRLLQRVRRAAHATARRRGFSSRNGHYRTL